MISRQHVDEPGDSIQRIAYLVIDARQESIPSIVRLPELLVLEDGDSLDLESDTLRERHQ
jgi:hypothetical protein